MKKILVLGGPGSGKTFLASKLSAKLGIPIYNLDTYYYKPNWQPVDRADFIAAQRMLLEKPEFIIDGNCVRVLSEALPQVDTMIFLDMPLYLRVCRVLWRDLFTRSGKLPEGCTFSWWQFWSFLRKNVIGFNKRKEILEIIAQYSNVKFVHIRSAQELQEFMAKYC